MHIIPESSGTGVCVATSSSQHLSFVFVFLILNSAPHKDSNRPAAMSSSDSSENFSLLSYVLDPQNWIIEEYHPEVALEKGIYYPHAFDLFYAVLIGILLTFFHMWLTERVSKPLARFAMPVVIGAHIDPPAALKEKRFMKHYHKTSPKRRTAEWLARLCGESDEKEVGVWIDAVKNHELALKAEFKFAGSCFRLLHYSLAVIIGIYCLMDKPWFHDRELLWLDFPYHHVDNYILFYYMYSLGFYLHSTIFHFIEPKKDDFWEMLIHHIATILLIAFSYWSNCIRIGCIILLVHDVSDPFLELGKLLNYAEGKKADLLADIVFAVFALVFWVARLVILPFVVLRVTLVSPCAHGWCRLPTYYFFNFLLLVLLAISMYWSWVIFRMAYDVVVGNGLKDGREAEDFENMKKVQEKRSETGSTSSPTKKARSKKVD